jgi:hypothetical protein
MNWLKWLVLIVIETTNVSSPNQIFDLHMEQRLVLLI